ncbi:hypothetical protein MC7420_4114 [Coleofasciculus chthonoplastes PCC 7420]|uniref:Uncharacterized protein n=1 Tax=Coleofasciculus chthonoplastes PCC 7420 TaxID=118168 RepID=B4VV22_9CYAN|nr:hypothetical protein MC7420_4114 [Coleofasciculus chthonoplastes PCC 7420]
MKESQLEDSWGCQPRYNFCSTYKLVDTIKLGARRCAPT